MALLLSHPGGGTVPAMSLADRLPGRHRARTLRPLVIGGASIGVAPIVGRIGPVRQVAGVVPGPSSLLRLDVCPCRFRRPWREAVATGPRRLEAANDDRNAGRPPHARKSDMDSSTLRIDASNHRLRRVGRLTRRRMRIEGSNLTNGIHTDGRLSVVISGLGNADDDGAQTFQWWANRPVALVIARSGADGADVSFSTGPIRWGTGVQRHAGGAEIGYIAFCYDTEREIVPAPAAPKSSTPVAAILARMLRSASPA